MLCNIENILVVVNERSTISRPRNTKLRFFWRKMESKLYNKRQNLKKIKIKRDRPLKRKYYWAARILAYGFTLCVNSGN